MKLGGEDWKDLQRLHLGNYPLRNLPKKQRINKPRRLKFLENKSLILVQDTLTPNRISERGKLTPCEEFSANTCMARSWDKSWGLRRKALVVIVLKITFCLVLLVVNVLYEFLFPFSFSSFCVIICRTVFFKVTCNWQIVQNIRPFKCMSFKL